MELVITVGLQGAGKSTFYRNHFAASHVLVSKDLFRHNRRPERRQMQLVEEALAAGRSLVVDNTNPRRDDRQRLIELGHAYGALVAGYFFDVPVQVCLERNRQRAGKQRVPDIAIFATAKKLEPPAYDEGFDVLYRVRSIEAGSYQVEALGRDERDARGPSAAGTGA